MDLRSTQLKDTYGNLVTTGTTAGSPTSGGLQNGQGTLLTSVGIGTNSPNQLLEVANSSGGATINISTDQTAGSIASKKFNNLDFSGFNNSVLARIQSWDESSSTGHGYLTFHTFKSGESLTEQMRIDYNGNVGIGTASPSTDALHVVAPGLSDDDDTIVLGANFSSAVRLGSIGTHHTDVNNGGLKFSSKIAGTLTEAMRIDSSGIVQIGTTSETYGANALNVVGAHTLLSSAAGGNLAIYTSDSQAINKGGSIALGGSYTGTIGYQFAGIAGLKENATAGDASGYLALYTTNSSNSTIERMRIDSSGNVLVGKTSSNPNTEGVQIYPNGLLAISQDGGRPLYINRNTSDGELVEFKKDGTTVGSIGVTSGSFAIGQTDTGIGFFNGDRIAFPATSAGAVQDNAIDLGYSSGRWDDVYATNGTIQTSDRNEKQDIEELNDAELRVAQQAKTLLRKYRWKSSVESKGDDARIHFGIIAQDLEQAFTDEGLDAGRYGMFIKSTWTNEDGEEQTRLGVRYNQLLAFIISSI